MTKVVGLDFDNVLNDEAWIDAVNEQFPGVRVYNPEVGKAMLDPVRCARVQRICEATGASLLLVTGWRAWAPAEELAELLRSRGLTAPVLGSVGGVKMSGDLRAWAFLHWMKEHPEVSRYVVLDDTKRHWDGWLQEKGLQQMLIAPKDGIEEEHVVRAIEILNAT